MLICQGFINKQIFQYLSKRLYGNNNQNFANRLLGLDVGDRYIGVSVTSKDNKFAVPLKTLNRKVEYDYGGDKGIKLISTKIEHIADLLRELKSEYNAFGMVIGLPLDINGKETKQAKKNREFISILETFGGLDTEIYWTDETNTTINAVDNLLYNANSKIENQFTIKNKKTGKWDKGRNKTKSRKKSTNFSDLSKESIDNQAAALILESFLVEININAP